LLQAPIRSELEDASELVAAIRRGDASAFTALMANYAPMLRAVVAAGLDAELRAVIDADDVQQEILITLYRKLPDLEFRGPGAFRRWLRTVAESRLQDLRRRHFCGKRRPTALRSLDEAAGASPSGSEQFVGDQLPASGPGPSTLAAGREQEQGLGAVLAAIPPHYRNVLEQVMVRRRATADVARESGSTPEAVRKMVSRAVQACKDVLASRGRAPEQRP
jgi:RNA polymerase sigma factor (sigma-70 family)